MLKFTESICELPSNCSSFIRLNNFVIKFVTYIIQITDIQKMQHVRAVTVCKIKFLTIQVVLLQSYYFHVQLSLVFHLKNCSFGGLGFFSLGIQC